MFLIFFDYGMLVLFFALPQFVLTGAVPILLAVLLLVRNIFHAENVSLSSDHNSLTLKTSWIYKRFKQQVVKLDNASIKYIALKYKETKTKRWLIIAVLMLITIEIFLQNAIDLWGFARIAPLLVIGTILMFLGIVLFTFGPRRFLEVGTNEESIFVPFKNLSKEKTQALLTILHLPANIGDKKSYIKEIYKNIHAQLSDFVLGVYLIIIGLIFSFTTLFYGSFTRIVAIIFGMKLILRVLNGEPIFTTSAEKDLFIGCSPKLTFLKTTESDIERNKSFSPLRFHPLEILCIAYIISQAIKYAFRFVWWPYACFNISYFLIGITLIGLLFVRWFNPYEMYTIKFKEFSIKLRVSEIKPILQRFVKFFANFNQIKTNNSLIISIVLFLMFLIWPIFYYLFGGNFLII